MSTLSLRLPESMHSALRTLAQREGISINQLITIAVAEKLSALMTEEYLQKRAERGSRARYEAALALVPDVDAEEYDKISTDVIKPPSPAQNWRLNETGEAYFTDPDADQ